MAVTIKKAGEAVAKKVIQSSTAQKGAVQAATPVVPPRAVSKEEAPRMKPAAESTKTSMMPWRGWFDRYMQEKLSPETYDRVRSTFMFKPDDPYKLQQIPMPTDKIPISNDGQEAGFREVSPGSQPAVRVPRLELDEDPYDSGYFKRDTRRRYLDPEFPNREIESIKLNMLDPEDPEVQEAKEKLAAGPQSSKGNGGRFPTGPTDFDPTGLRANMSVTPAALEASLDKYMPNHLPEPTWKDEEEKLLNWYKERDLPLPMGGTWNFVRKERRIARW